VQVDPATMADDGKDSLKDEVLTNSFAENTYGSILTLITDSQRTEARIVSSN
jgi:hypothetical protein